MKKTLATTLVVTMIVVASPAFAQTKDFNSSKSNTVTSVLAELPKPGMTPASPFYFVERFFESVGTFFTFGNNVKAERYLALSEERLAEALVLAEQGEGILAAAVIPMFQDQSERARVSAKAVELAEGRKGLNAVNVKTARQEGDPIPDIDITTDQPNRNSGQDTDGDGVLDPLARVTDATTKHLTVLDLVLERVPEQAKASIEAAIERSMQGQIDSLREIAQRDPGVAAEVFERAVQARAEGRLKIGDITGEAWMFEEDDEDMEERTGRSKTTEAKVMLGGRLAEEFELYTELGKEISALAEGLQAGETTVEEIVERAISHYRDVLRDVQSKVSPQAQESTQRVLDGSRPNADLQTTPAPQPQRSIPENSIERTDSDNEIEGSEVDSFEVDSFFDIFTEVEVEKDTEAGAGGPPAETPANPDGRSQSQY